MRTFSLEAILSVYTGVLLCEFENVERLLKYMTSDDNLFTHQLSRAANECTPYIVAQLPWLAEVDAENVTPDNYLSWLAEQLARYGGEYSLNPMPQDDHDTINLIEEMASMMGGEYGRDSDA